ncbi:MAG: hypothetical protein NTX61_16765 [Bacteroidetes bacterium]|nr:hypothetical protein [Bacteroidota bacterium]
MRSKFIKVIFSAIAVVIVILVVQACMNYQFRSNYTDANKLLHGTHNLETKPFLKAHLKNGDICILMDSWKVDTVKNLVNGKGTRYDFNRNLKYEGSLSIGLDSVAIFETNTKLVHTEDLRILALGLLAGVDIVIGIICLTTPKACFGSCPTFYMNEYDNFHYADAEGFSNAISPSLEYADIDALNNKPLTGNIFSITMRNEALETHCVNDVKLLAYPRKENERVYHTRQDEFYLCDKIYPLSAASANEGDITTLLQKDDRLERFSLADENNLGSKEEIFLTYDNVKKTDDLGLIVSFRQTLMTTYLFYSTMGYMGDEVGDIFAGIETKKFKNETIWSLNKELGDIDVYTWNEAMNAWDFQGGWYETGPIAVNHQILPLKTSLSGKTITVKLVMNKGLWRLDYLALTNIKEKVKPVEISPDLILNKGRIDGNALSAIKDPEKYLISMPGSSYKFNFTLPEPDRDYELFLYSKGYYLEWMRAHWLKDKDLLSLKLMIDNPKKYLQREASSYKKYETEMEEIFWNSKIDTQLFSYNEN